MSNEIQYGNNLIPISQIVSRTKVRLQLKDVTDYDSEIEMFINEAAQSLGTKPTFRKKNCKIKVCNGKATLPAGFKKLNGVRLCQGNSNTLTNESNTNQIFNGQFLNPDLIYIERAYLGECAEQCAQAGIKGGVINPFEGTIEIIGNKIVFPVPFDYDNVVVSYDGWATTEDGILELAAVYERGFSEYAVAKMLESYPQLWQPEWGSRENQIQRSWQDWVGQRTKLVSDSFADSYVNNKYMVKRMLNSLLQDQNSPLIQ